MVRVVTVVTTCRVSESGPPRNLGILDFVVGIPTGRRTSSPVLEGISSPAAIVSVSNRHLRDHCDHRDHRDHSSVATLLDRGEKPPSSRHELCMTNRGACRCERVWTPRSEFGKSNAEMRGTKRGQFSPVLGGTKINSGEGVR